MDLKEMAERKYKLSLENIELKKRITELSEKLAKMKLEKKKEVLEAVDENGKKMHKNQDERDIALKFMIYSDIDYQAMLADVRNLYDRIDANNAFIEFANDMIKLFEGGAVDGHGNCKEEA